jgi:dimethylaniline monooxygenase (N-oxide forming)
VPCLTSLYFVGRGYESFWTQWTVGTAEYSDVPMPRPPETDTYFEVFKAKHTTQYLENYVDIQAFAGQTLRDRIKLRIEVESVQKDGEGEGWILSTKERFTGVEHKYCTSKLMVASGLTSIPNMPSLPGDKAFKGQIIHQYACSRACSLAFITRLTLTRHTPSLQISQEHMDIDTLYWNTADFGPLQRKLRII